MVDFSMGCSWTANQKRPRSAKENVDNFLDKDTRRRPATAADVPPANREFGRCSHAAHQTSYASCRSYYEHSPLCKRTCKRSGTAATLESRGGGDWGLNDGERAPPGGLPKAGAAAKEPRRSSMTASARHPAAQPRPGRRGRGGSMTASARHQAAQPRPGRRQWRGSMTASARHPAAHPRPGRRRT